MNSRLAFSISVIFHPVFLNLLGVGIILLADPYLLAHYTTSVKWWLGGILIVNTILIPLTTVVVLRLSKRVTSLTLKTREERQLPFLITGCAYLFTYYLFSRLSVATMATNYLLSTSAIIIFALLINSWYKISLHGAAIGGFIGLIVALSHSAAIDLRPFLVAALCIGGITASARLFAEAHNPTQLTLGFSLGFLIMFFII